jgi:hypothetical protein
MFLTESSEVFVRQDDSCRHEDRRIKDLIEILI